MLRRDSSTPRFSRYCAPPLIVSKTDFIRAGLMQYVGAMSKGGNRERVKGGRW